MSKSSSCPTPTNPLLFPASVSVNSTSSHSGQSFRVILVSSLFLSPISNLTANLFSFLFKLHPDSKYCSPPTTDYYNNIMIGLPMSTIVLLTYYFQKSSLSTPIHASVGLSFICSKSH